MSVLVTGSSGYIGKWFIDRLCRAGVSVIGLDRQQPDAGRGGPPRFVHRDLLDDEPLEHVLEQVDEIIHLAAAKDDWGLSRDEYFRDNLLATERLISSARNVGVRKWTFYSSVGVLGSGLLARPEGADYRPETAYAESKVAAEKAFFEYAHSAPDACVNIVRPSAVFSPNNPENNNLYRLIEALGSGRFVMVGAGADPKAVSYLPNLIDATLFLQRRWEPGVHTYNYIEEPVWSTRQLVDTICDELSRPRPKLHVPSFFAAGVSGGLDLLASLTGKDIPVTSARIRKFCTPTNFSSAKLRQLGFVPAVSMEEAVRETVAFHRSDRAAPPRRSRSSSRSMPAADRGPVIPVRQHSERAA